MPNVPAMIEDLKKFSSQLEKKVIPLVIQEINKTASKPGPSYASDEEEAPANMGIVQGNSQLLVTRAFTDIARKPFNFKHKGIQNDALGWFLNSIDRVYYSIDEKSRKTSEVIPTAIIISQPEQTLPESLGYQNVDNEIIQMEEHYQTDCPKFVYCAYTAKLNSGPLTQNQPAENTSFTFYNQQIDDGHPTTAKKVEIWHINNIENDCVNLNFQDFQLVYSLIKRHNPAPTIQILSPVIIAGYEGNLASASMLALAMDIARKYESLPTTSPKKVAKVLAEIVSKVHTNLSPRPNAKFLSDGQTAWSIKLATVLRAAAIVDAALDEITAYNPWGGQEKKNVLGELVDYCRKIPSIDRIREEIAKAKNNDVLNTHKHGTFFGASSSEDKPRPAPKSVELVTELGTAYENMVEHYQQFLGVAVPDNAPRHDR